MYQLDANFWLWLYVCSEMFKIIDNIEKIKRVWQAVSTYVIKLDDD